jgi:hypothetical protein
MALDVEPNPFNPAATVSYRVPSRGRVTISLFNAGGRKTATLVDKVRDAGSYSFRLDARSVNGRTMASGCYYLVYRAGGKVRTVSLVFLK